MVQFTDTQTRSLAQLRRFPIWVEVARSQGLIRLETVGRSGQPVQEVFDEAVLSGLLEAGLVDVSSQQRIAEVCWSANPRPHRVTQTYWKVVTS